MIHSAKRKNRLRHSLFIWHRYIGVSVALIVVFLSVTGLLLNHTETFKLDERRIQNSLILDHYGLKLSPPKKGFQLAHKWLTQVEEQLYLDANPLSIRESNPLMGAIKTANFTAIAFNHQIILVTDNGELIEKITSLQGLPKQIQRIGKNGLGQIVIQSTQGTFYSDDDLLSWKQAMHGAHHWAKASVIPTKLSEQVAQDFRQNTIPLERFILDIHSGRFFGIAGVLFVDLATLLFLFLAFSGFWLWLRQTRQKRRKK
jgi:hypothetical protein